MLGHCSLQGCTAVGVTWRHLRPGWALPAGSCARSGMRAASHLAQSFQRKPPRLAAIMQRAQLPSVVCSAVHHPPGVFHDAALPPQHLELPGNEAVVVRVPCLCGDANSVAGTRKHGDLMRSAWPWEQAGIGTLTVETGQPRFTRLSPFLCLCPCQNPCLRQGRATAKPPGRGGSRRRTSRERLPPGHPDRHDGLVQ